MPTKIESMRSASFGCSEASLKNSTSTRMLVEVAVQQRERLGDVRPDGVVDLVNGRLAELAGRLGAGEVSSSERTRRRS